MGVFIEPGNYALAVLEFQDALDIDPMHPQYIFQLQMRTVD